MNICYIKKPLVINIKQKHITYVSMLLNTAIMGKQLSARVNQVQYTVVKGIILF